MNGRADLPDAIRAKWGLLPGGRLVDDVALEAAGGRIVRVGPPRGGERDLGEVLLVPGLVDAHVHLELSGLPAVSAAGGFASWALRLGLRRAIASRRALARAAAAALDALCAEGVTCVGEVATVGASRGALLARTVTGTWYREMIDLRPARAPATLARARARAGRETRGLGLLPGLFPHAPYSASGALFRAAAAHARAAGIPFATHAAESRDERALFARGEGPLATVRRLAGAGRRMGPSPLSPIAWLDAAGALWEGAALVHATYASGDDVVLLRARGCAVVVCPRSALHLEGTVADVGRLLSAGIPVGLGTDSPASAGTPSLREEMRTLARAQGGVAPGAVIAAATEGGARALGLAGECGALAPGARADVAAFEVPDPGEPLACVATGARSWVAMRAGEARPRG